jgi:hypothetical protein
MDPWTMWGVVHGGPATMAGTEPHRSSAMGRSVRRGLAVVDGKEEDDVAIPFCFLLEIGRRRGGC